MSCIDCSDNCVCEAPPCEKKDSYPANSRMVTVSDGDNTLIITAYSNDSDNRIVINSVDMGFGEFRQYLNTVGMVDDHERLENNRCDEMIAVVQYTILGLLLFLFGLSSWVVLLVSGYSKLQA